MNIFHKFTRKTLAKNRTRTVVTIVGIMLSMALFTAVIEGAYSGLEFLKRSEIERSGSYHAFYPCVPEEQAEELVKNENIKDYATWQFVGWGEWDVMPRVAVASVSDNLPKLVSTRLVEGRMPANEHEVVIPDNLNKISAKPCYVGDSITISLKDCLDGDGDNAIYGSAAGSVAEYADKGEYTYQVVGVYRCYEDWTITGTCDALLLTKGQADGPVNVFFTIKKVREFYYGFLFNDNVPDCNTHIDLLLYCGVTGNDNLMTLVYGFAAILVIIIAAGSISLIYNSFAISVSERTKQFGVLKSIGATKKQLRQSVLYEAGFLAGIGIVLGVFLGCAGIGVTFRCLQDAFANLISYPDATVKIRLILNPWALLAAAAVCLVTVLISAWLPARRTAKINAIEAVRQTNDVKIQGREVRTSGLTQKLFGFEGMMAAKNFKRNRKRYRSTVISLFLSIVLFISASAFCSYLTKAVETVGGSTVLSDVQYSTRGNGQEPGFAENMMRSLSNAAGVTDSMYMDISSEEFRISEEFVDGTYAKKPGYTAKDGIATFGASFVFLQDDVFRSVCAKNHLDADVYFNANELTGILYNTGNERYMKEGDKAEKWYSFKVLNESAMPCTMQHRKVFAYDDYLFLESVTEDGKRYNLFYPLEAMAQTEWDENNRLIRDESLDWKCPAEESEVNVELHVNGVIETTLFALRPDTPAIILPYSMRPVLTEQYGDHWLYSTSFDFRSSNHKQTYEEMERILEENGVADYRLRDLRSDQETKRTIVTVVKVFSYGFIVLISLIAIANVFNTISTNVVLRRREFAMLKSVGLGRKGFRKMMNYECIIYGLKGIVFGLPVALLITYVIYRVTGAALSVPFFLPWLSIGIAVGSVFLVVFATMLYATGKIRNDNPIDALKNENI